MGSQQQTQKQLSLMHITHEPHCTRYTPGYIQLDQGLVNESSHCGTASLLAIMDRVAATIQAGETKHEQRAANLQDCVAQIMPSVAQTPAADKDCYEYSDQEQLCTVTLHCHIVSFKYVEIDAMRMNMTACGRAWIMGTAMVVNLLGPPLTTG